MLNTSTTLRNEPITNNRNQILWQVFKQMAALELQFLRSLLSSTDRPYISPYHDKNAGARHSKNGRRRRLLSLVTPETIHMDLLL